MKPNVVVFFTTVTACAVLAAYQFGFDHGFDSARTKCIPPVEGAKLISSTHRLSDGVQCQWGVNKKGWRWLTTKGVKA